MKKTEILPTDIWNDNKITVVNEFIKSHSEAQSEEMKIRNKFLAIQYKLEDYIEKDIDENEVLEILDFVKMYLKALNITKLEMAHYFGMKDSNLHKYLVGSRKLNPEVVLKIAAFSHTNPEHCYSVEINNEFAKFRKENTTAYDTYDYRKLLSS